MLNSASVNLVAIKQLTVSRLDSQKNMCNINDNNIFSKELYSLKTHCVRNVNSLGRNGSLLYVPQVDK